MVRSETIQTKEKKEVEEVKDPCVLKVPFIVSKLDKFQPNWRKGEDISAKTKKKIHDYVKGKYKDEEFPVEITDKTIENSACKARKELGIKNRKALANYRKKENSENNDEKKNPPGLGGSTENNEQVATPTRKISTQRKNGLLEQNCSNIDMV